MEEIRDAYCKISKSYLRKKQQPWRDLLEILPELETTVAGILVDVGGGNGRNIASANWTLTVCLDLTSDLLQNYVGSADHQLIEGSLPSLPFRKTSSDMTISIAVVHHLKNPETRKLAVNNLVRITSNGGDVIYTVWRKWRPENARRIIHLLKEGKETIGLVDHLRPWKDSFGNVLAYRFYHYYSRREILEETADYSDVTVITMGGKSRKDNFLVRIRKN